MNPITNSSRLSLRSRIGLVAIGVVMLLSLACSIAFAQPPDPCKASCHTQTTALGDGSVHFFV